AERASVVILRRPVNDRHTKPLTKAVIGRGEPNDAGSNDQNTLGHEVSLELRISDCRFQNPQSENLQSLSNSPAKRISLVQVQRCLGDDKCGAGDRWTDGRLGAVQPPIRSLESAADDAFLYPRLVLSQGAIGGQARQLGAGAGAAGGAIISL